MKKIVLWGLLSISLLGRAAEPEIRVFADEALREQPLITPVSANFVITEEREQDGRVVNRFDCDSKIAFDFAKLFDPEENFQAFLHAAAFSVVDDPYLILTAEEEQHGRRRSLVIPENLEIAGRFAPQTINNFRGYALQMLQAGFEYASDMKNRKIAVLKRDHERTTGALSRLHARENQAAEEEIQELEEKCRALEIQAQNSYNQGLVDARKQLGFVEPATYEETSTKSVLEDLSNAHNWLPSKKVLAEMLQLRLIADESVAVLRGKPLHAYFDRSYNLELAQILLKGKDREIAKAYARSEYFKLDIPYIRATDEKVQNVFDLYKKIAPLMGNKISTPLLLFALMAKNSIAEGTINEDAKGVYKTKNMLTNLLPLAEAEYVGLSKEQDAAGGGGGAGKSDEAVAVAEVLTGGSDVNTKARL